MVDLTALAPAPPLYTQAAQDQPTIRARMVANLPAAEDTASGSFVGDALDVAVFELAQLPPTVQRLLRSTFMAYPECAGVLVDLRAQERGLSRLTATFATVTVRFTAPAGTTIPSGTRISTAAASTTPAVSFATTLAATVPGAGSSVDVTAVASAAGSGGNVPAASLVQLVDSVAGVTAVTNPSPATGGTNAESDASLKTRYFDAVANAGAGGNAAQYRQWARAVPGVGAVQVIRAWNGPSTVEIVLLGSDGTPANLATVQAVENSIIDPWRLAYEGETLTVGATGGGGTSPGVTQSVTDAAASGGHAAEMVYSASGNGQLTQSRLDLLLPQPGVWMVRPIIRRDSATGSGSLFTIEVWNLTTAAVATVSPSSSGSATLTYTGSELDATYPDTLTAPSVDFWWNGTDQLELRLLRLTSDVTTAVYVDQVLYQASMSRDDEDLALQPLADRVTVVPATGVPVDVSATLTIASGYDGASVRTAATTALQTLLTGLAFAPNNDVLYLSVGAALVNTPGVIGVTGLTVNGSTADITIGPAEVATLGTVTLS